jgi:AraC-like DNA-binding protein
MCNSRFCSIVQNTAGGLAKCKKTDCDKCEEAKKSEDTILYRCHAGLQEAIFPLKVRGRLVGYLMIGQFRTSDEVPAEFSAFNEETRKKLTEAFYELPCYPPEKFNCILAIFDILIDYFSVREFAVLRTDQLRSEIDRYIAQHISGNLKLSDMAKALGKSVSTISQFLRRNYATNFKELVTNAKLDIAEKFWQENPSASVAEAAAAAWFTDQFYFSRVFRKNRGITPACYRARIRKKEI